MRIELPLFGKRVYNPLGNDTLCYHYKFRNETKNCSLFVIWLVVLMYHTIDFDFEIQVSNLVVHVFAASDK